MAAVRKTGFTMHRQILQTLGACLIALGVLFSTGAFGQASDSEAIVPPIGPGPYPVACSNVAQDFSRLQPGDTPDAYWEGEPAAGRARYVTSLLADPANAFVVNL